ncbi:MAG: hypothetical protein ABL993_00430 [Vicinamibacterales bacterium]
MGGSVGDAVARRWRTAAHGFALLAGGLLAVFLLGIPVQLSDSLANLLPFPDASLAEIVRRGFQPGPYLRPFLTGLLKLVFDLSGGHYFAWFRGFQAIQVVALLVLVVRILGPRTLWGASLVPLALAALLGMHTFAGTVREAFPINTFLTILLCCAGAASLSESRSRPVVDLAAVLLLIFAMLTVETGLLVWVVFVVAWLIGARGVSRRGMVALTVCLAGYFVFRFVILGGATPGLSERDSGFGLSTYGGDDLARMFGNNPMLFYAYNVTSAMATVLFAEPRGGVWAAVRDALSGDLRWWQIINVLTSVLTTSLIARHVVSRWRHWRQGLVDDDDRLVLLFLALLPANALFAYAYAKDVIMSPAGLFYALAAYAAVKSAAESAAGKVTLRSISVVVCLALVACGWSVRFVGLHYNLRQRAASVRDEWAYFSDWQREQGPSEMLVTPTHRRIRDSLYEDAIRRTPKPPALALSWADEIFDRSQ